MVESKMCGSWALRSTAARRPSQRAAEKAITYGIGRAFENDNWWADGGAIVALNPADG